MTSDQKFSNFWHPAGTTESKDNHVASRFLSIDINLVHPIYSTQKAIDHFLRNSKPGSVVHVSSIAAQVPFLSAPFYVAAKSGISNFVRCMTDLEKPQRQGVSPIRVTGVAPGVIRTPLWTENMQKRAWIDEGKDEWVEPEDVAQVMLDLIVKEEHVGGTILEIGKGQVRPVTTLNDVGPSGAGHTISSVGKGTDEVWDIISKQRAS
ncbi:short chain dehydrogenase domain-containing protein [Sarocladium implicatum]|nr:short chain dehydrogenase domain-containing protein [Sarocladium implicatum]